VVAWGLPPLQASRPGADRPPILRRIGATLWAFICGCAALLFLLCLGGILLTWEVILGLWETPRWLRHWAMGTGVWDGPPLAPPGALGAYAATAGGGGAGTSDWSRGRWVVASSGEPLAAGVVGRQRESGAVQPPPAEWMYPSGPPAAWLLATPAPPAPLPTTSACPSRRDDVPAAAARAVAVADGGGHALPTEAEHARRGARLERCPEELQATVAAAQRRLMTCGGAWSWSDVDGLHEPALLLREMGRLPRDFGKGSYDGCGGGGGGFESAAGGSASAAHPAAILAALLGARWLHPLCGEPACVTIARFAAAPATATDGGGDGSAGPSGDDADGSAVRACAALQEERVLATARGIVNALEMSTDNAPQPSSLAADALPPPPAPFRLGVLEAAAALCPWRSDPEGHLVPRVFPAGSAAQLRCEPPPPQAPLGTEVAAELGRALAAAALAAGAEGAMGAAWAWLSDQLREMGDAAWRLYVEIRLCRAAWRRDAIEREADWAMGGGWSGAVGAKSAARRGIFERGGSADPHDVEVLLKATPRPSAGSDNDSDATSESGSSAADSDDLGGTPPRARGRAGHRATGAEAADPALARLNLRRDALEARTLALHLEAAALDARVDCRRACQRAATLALSAWLGEGGLWGGDPAHKAVGWGGPWTVLVRWLRKSPEGPIERRGVERARRAAALLWAGRTLSRAVTESLAASMAAAGAAERGEGPGDELALEHHAEGALVRAMAGAWLAWAQMWRGLAGAGTGSGGVHGSRARAAFRAAVRLRKVGRKG